MAGTDLELIDQDPADPFDFSIAQYNDMLVAGYSRNTPARGLKTYLPDYDDLKAGRRVAHTPGEARRMVAATPVTEPGLRRPRRYSEVMDRFGVAAVLREIGALLELQGGQPVQGARLRAGRAGARSVRAAISTPWSPSAG